MVASNCAEAVAAAVVLALSLEEASCLAREREGGRRRRVFKASGSLMPMVRWSTVMRPISLKADDSVCAAGGKLQVLVDSLTWQSLLPRIDLSSLAWKLLIDSMKLSQPFPSLPVVFVC